MLRKAKVSDLNMTVIGKEDVFWLQVAVYDLVSVEVVESHSHFGGIELRHWIREPLQEADERRESIQVYRNRADQ